VDEIKRNGLILLTNVFKILCRSKQFTSLSYVIEKTNLLRLSKAIALLLQESNSYITLSSAIEFLIHVVHNQSGRNGDAQHLFLATFNNGSGQGEIADFKPLLFSLNYWIKKSNLLYHEAPFLLYNIQRLILALFEKVKDQPINETLFLIIFPPNNLKSVAENGKSFWEHICYPLETIKYNTSNIAKFDCRKISSMRKLVSAVSDVHKLSNSNSFLENDREVEFKREDGVWIQCEIARVNNDNFSGSKAARNSKEARETYDIDFYDEGGLRTSMRQVPPDKLRKISFDTLGEETVDHCYKLNCHAMALEILTQEYHDILKEVGKYSFAEKESVLIRYKIKGKTDKDIDRYTEWIGREGNVKCAKKFEKDKGVAIDLKLHVRNPQYGPWDDLIYNRVSSDQNCTDDIIYLPVEDCRILYKMPNKTYVTLKELVAEYKKANADIFVTQFQRYCEIYLKVTPLVVSKSLVDKISTKQEEENLVDCIFEKLSKLKLDIKHSFLIFHH